MRKTRHLLNTLNYSHYTVTIPTTSNQHEAQSSSYTSSTLRRTGRSHIPITKAVDAYDMLSCSFDEEDDACFLCGKTEPPEPISGNVDWIVCQNCERWYHEQCIGHPVDDLYNCHLCLLPPV